MRSALLLLLLCILLLGLFRGSLSSTLLEFPLVPLAFLLAPGWLGRLHCHRVARRSGTRLVCEASLAELYPVCLRIHTGINAVIRAAS